MKECLTVKCGISYSISFRVLNKSIAFSYQKNDALSSRSPDLSGSTERSLSISGCKISPSKTQSK